MSRTIEQLLGRWPTLTRTDVDRAIGEASASEAGVAVARAVPKRGTGVGRIQVALAVRRADGIVVGIGTGRAPIPSPAQAWPELAPWRDGAVTAIAKARAWAARSGRDRVLVPASSARPATREDLLAAILDDPDDDAPRLVYADYLSERGDPRGELIALQCAKRPTPKSRRRARELLAKHGLAWAGAAGAVAKYVAFRRGFVARVSMAAGRWVSAGAALVARDPIEELVVLGRTSAVAMRAIAGSPQTARLRTLRFELGCSLRTAVDREALSALFASPHVTAIHTIDLKCGAPHAELRDLRRALPKVTWYPNDRPTAVELPEHPVILAGSPTACAIVDA